MHHFDHLNIPNYEQQYVEQTFVDARGRRLRVTAVQPGDPLGREVIGKLKKGDITKQYSTTMDIFKSIWIDQRPPMAPNEMRIG